MDFRVLMPVLISFIMSVILCPILIPFLRRLKFGQYVRDDGPETHLKKSGTPTMGGIIILLSVTLTSLIYVGQYQDMIPVLFATLGFGLIGFLDDYIKVVMKRSMGLRAWQKLVGQILVTAIFGYYLVNYTDVGSTMLIPFTGGFNGGNYINWSYLFIPVLFIVFLGTVNGANFTDGLDGLASSVTLLIATFFSVVAIGIHSGISPITCAVAGSLLGFLVFNIYPARVFMGDTGSLALGGFVAASAYMLRMPLFILIVALIYLVEVLSVILQVGYFKLTGGKRIFKMAPIHHHFELCGWPETRVVAVFSIVTAVLCLIALMGI
jgi:phospho-N-acetylmuramoyl-pentapeptide-transferase